MKPPNILFLFTDQQRPDAIGVSGNTAIRTPNMDRIALEGAYFSQACCNAPVCMPSRHSLFTGLYPSVIGNTCNGIELPEDQHIFPQALHDRGYWTAAIGKLHFLNHSGRDHSLPHPSYGFDRMENADEPGCYEDRYIDWVRAKAPDQLEACRCSSPPVCLGPKIEVEGREVDEPYAFRAPAELSHSAFVAERSIAAIEDAPGDQPWFVSAGFYAPHAPLNPPRELWDAYLSEDLPEPAWPEGMHNPRGHSLAEWKRIIAAYYALTTHVDEQVGRLLDHLDAAGLAGNTLVVFSSDHGEFLGDHGRVQKGPPGNDCIMRVPLAIRWPQGIPGGIRTDACVELVDLAPTFLDLAGIQIPGAYQGMSLRPLLEGTGEWPRLYCFQEYHKEGNGWQTIRNRRFTYARSTSGEEILWDRETDPHEFNNQAQCPEMIERLNQLRAELDRRIPKDPRPIRPRTGAY